jgi:CheY-like chemotaxis protein
MISNDTYDYRRYAILFVDDEEKTRKYFRRLYGESFRILEASDGVEALEVFRKHADEIGVIVTDQRMPNETGVGFLSKIAEAYPDIVKILSTAFSDLDAAIGSVNQGGIYRYLTKPWDIPQMEVTLHRAMEFFIVKRERDGLLSAKIQALGNVMLSGRLASFALVPVCQGTGCGRAAEAIAAFVRLGVSGRGTASSGNEMFRGPVWGEVHVRQLELAGALAKELPLALAKGASLKEGRVQALADALTAASASGVALVPGESSTRITASSDPLPTLLDSLLGTDTEGKTTAAAARVLAALMAVYDAGGSVRRTRQSDAPLGLDVTSEASRNEETTPGADVGRWLFDDEMLISSALGLL